ncbi:hypothetical protein V7S43_010465 [Phytophthora oleae]|uniref:Elicitor-like transglutaminase n=1 Tax=Phytophthora oleae TaxID=2107226 RepID=A0ABD3FE73_9STRA
MVKVERFAVIGAVFMASVDATSMKCGTTQATPLGAPMNECNPAYGGEIDPTCMPAVAITDTEGCEQATGSAMDEIVGSLTGTSADGTRSLRRMEDASNSDVADLESYFGESLELDFTTLKEQYSSASAPTTPWPGSYWPTYQDGINVIWKSGDVSASEKYANAFGLDPTDFKNKISVKTGIDSRSNSTQCTADTDCTSRNDGSVCAKRKEAESGYCIPTWYGICHAWSPAALLEAEPLCDVVKNNQTFHVLDIKALITDVYDGSSISTVFTGARFNGPDSPEDMDTYGRYTSAPRRDLGPGFFHIAIANILGKHKQSFILDVTAGSQVWNQPVRSYQVQTMELVDADEASQKYFGVSPYPFNSEMVYLAYVKTTVSWIVEAYADGPLVSSGQVDAYTVSDDYLYVLELDANYAVIGGEWVEGSKTDHPDFLWFPTAKPDASTVTSTGLSYAHVQELLELSLACGSSGSTSENASASTSTSASTSSSSNGSTSTSTSASSSGSTSSSASRSNNESTSASNTYSTSASTSASNSGSTGRSTSSSTSGSTSSSASSSTSSASASTGTSEAVSASTNSSASGSQTTSSSGYTSSGSTSSGSASSNSAASGSTGTEAPLTAYSGSGTNENASAGSVSKSGEGSYAAWSASEDKSAAGQGSTPASGSAGTTDATSTYTSATGSTAEDTGASLPSGKDALILTPESTSSSTSTDEESTPATTTVYPTGIGYYTPPPTTDGQDLADVLNTTSPTDSSAPVTDAPSEGESPDTTAPVHRSC